MNALVAVLRDWLDLSGTYETM